MYNIDNCTGYVQKWKMKEKEKMKVYKVNKGSMIGSVAIFIMLVALYTVPLFIESGFWQGVCFGSANMFIILHVTGISSLNNEKLPIEKIEIEDNIVVEKSQSGNNRPGKGFPGPSYQTEGGRSKK